MKNRLNALKSYAILLCFQLLTCGTAVGQSDWTMLDLSETAKFTSTEQYCEHLKTVFKKTAASDNKDENCPCEWARTYDFPAPALGDRIGNARLRLFSANDLGVSEDRLDLSEMNRRADSAGYEPCNMRVALRLLELMKQGESIFIGHADLVVPVYNDTDVEFARVTYGHVATGMGKWLPGSGQKRAWLDDVSHTDRKFVYRKK